MLNWLLSAPTRLDWIIVLLVLIGIAWFLTTPFGMKIYMRWVANSTKKATADIFSDLFEVFEENEEP